jgi:protein-disulfide isomerase
VRPKLLFAGLLLALPAFAADHAWPIDETIGRPDAPITIIEYASLTCSHCALFDAEILPRLKREWLDTGKAKLVVRDFPRNSLDQAAAMISHCSNDRYLAFLDTYFHSQQNWMNAAQPIAALKGIARIGGMSGEDVDRCLGDRQLFAEIAQRGAEGKDLYGFEGTPAFIINGKPARYDGEYDTLVKQLK